ncbi:F-box/SPRY domain-containing protein 1 isoform X2 [Epargyreus clarus]|uniref:F-box/SPRY domain-containing protein 1 isoform X2 n=1 Tax=Epargyreus clarus TaxID=520877 RepID=UPI003C2D7430
MSRVRFNFYDHSPELPDHILETIFSYLSVLELRHCALVCKRWYRVLNDEDSDVWRTHCMKKLTEEVVKSELLIPLPSFKAKLRAFYHAWNPYDCSRNIYIKPNGFTLHRNPVAQSTDACRGKIGFQRGRHTWDIVWDGPLGTVAVIGISTKEAPLQCQGYVGLLGSDQHSWGWNLVDNQLLHNGETRGHYPLLNNCPRYQVGERIRVILDCEKHSLAFERGYEFLGVAFKDLPHEIIFPAISAVYGNTEVSMVYSGVPMDG